ncbi:MAG: Sec-independent protein translocase subunit TatA [Actinoallomurus sp.]
MLVELRNYRLYLDADPADSREGSTGEEKTMGEFSVSHWLIVIAVFVILFGSAKLPQAARSLGRSMRIFKSETRGLMSDDDEPTLSTQTLRDEAARLREEAARLEKPGDRPQELGAPARDTARQGD